MASYSADFYGVYLSWDSTNVDMKFLMHQVVYILRGGNSPEQKWIFPSFHILHRFQDTAQKTRDELVKLGFPEFTIDDFHENVS